MNYKVELQNNNIDLRALLDSINELPEASGSSIDTSDATASASEILSGKTAYVNGEKVTGTIPIQTTKYITPSSSAKVAISAGTYAGGDIIVEGDSELIASNIRAGSVIFGVIGRYVGSSGIDTSDATATAEDIAEGKTAYVNGEKIIGTHVDIPEDQLKSYYTGTIVPDDSIGNDGDLYLVKG